MIVIGYDLVSYLLHYSSARCVTFKELFVCKSNNKTGDFDMNLPDFFSISYKFFRKSGFIRAHHRTKGFWTNVCRLSHKRRKGLCLTPKQQFRLMRQGPFLLCLCQRGAFTAFQMIFLFRCSFEPEAESRVWPLVHKWSKPSPTAGKPGRMILSTRPDTSGRTDKTILPCRWFARFHATDYVLFWGDFLFSRISLLKFSV